MDGKISCICGKCHRKMSVRIAGENEDRNAEILIYETTEYADRRMSIIVPAELGEMIIEFLDKQKNVV